MGISGPISRCALVSARRALLIIAGCSLADGWLVDAERRVVLV